jgi:hypothetical protein
VTLSTTSLVISVHGGGYRTDFLLLSRDEPISRLEAGNQQVAELSFRSTVNVDRRVKRFTLVQYSSCL